MVNTATVMGYKEILYSISGTYLTDSIGISQTTGLKIHSANRDSVKLLTVNGDQIFYAVGDWKGLEISDLTLACTYSYSPVDFGHGLIFFENYNAKNIKILRNKFYMPFANATAINILVRTSVPYTGSWDDIDVEDNIADSIGQSFLSLLNRDTTGIAELVAGIGNTTNAVPISSTGLNYGKNFKIINNHIGNLGLIGPYGLAVTLDGNGYNGLVSNNLIYNCLEIGLENTGFWYVKWDHNVFQTYVSGRLWEPWGFSTRPIYYNQLSYNQEADYATGEVDAFTIQYSTFDHNVIRTSGGLKLQNCSYNKFDEDYYYGGFNFNVWLIGITGPCVGNVFTNCFLDQSLSTVNFNNVMFDGTLCTGNIVKRLQIYFRI